MLNSYVNCAVSHRLTVTLLAYQKEKEEPLEIA